MVQELIFSVSEKTLKDGSTAVVLTDSEGYLCGIYATVADAEKAIPAIKRNITQGYVPKSCLVKQRNRTNTRQVSNRK
jgi:hypothetical protein